MNLIKISWVIWQQEEDKYANGILTTIPVIMTVYPQMVGGNYALLQYLWKERDSHAP